MGAISEKKVAELIVPFLSVGKRGFKSKLCLTKVMLLILKRLKTGCQWRELVVKEHFNDGEACWQSIYYYFNKWSKDGSFKQVWIHLLQSNKALIDLSTAQLDGSHTPAKRGGGSVGYQGRKACKTSNSLILSDNKGMPLCVGEPQDGKQNDLFDINRIFKGMLGVLESAEVPLDGVFLNADPGFDSEGFKKQCTDEEIELNVKANPRNTKKDTMEYTYFDERLYRGNRYKVEQSNAWMDAFKGTIIRYEKLTRNWWSMLWLCITAIFMRKIKV